MKKIAVLSLLISSVAFAASTNQYSTLEGNWTGTITKNFKEDSAGGKPTMGATGASASINLKTTATGVEGTSTTAGDTENWVINGDTYTWSNPEMSVSAKASTKLPVWAQAELAGLKGGKTFAFQFDSCKNLKTNSDCEVGKDIPQALKDSGIWVFKIDGTKMTTVVLYQYKSGRVRHLSEELTK